MKSVAFIPARGGSKRLPGKNTMLFAGKPLIYYTIAFAKYSGMDQVIVSTDDDEIAAVADQFGAGVLTRPEVLSSDTATTSAAARHCMEHLTKTGVQADVFVTLQPTNPLRPATLFTDALQTFATQKCDSVISVSMNKHKLGHVDNGCFKPQSYKPGMRSQDLEPLFYENGLIYLSQPENVLQDELFGENIQTIVIDELFAMADIDVALDFELAEFLYTSHRHLFNYLEK